MHWWGSGGHATRDRPAGRQAAQICSPQPASGPWPAATALWRCNCKVGPGSRRRRSHHTPQPKLQAPHPHIPAKSNTQMPNDRLLKRQPHLRHLKPICNARHRHDGIQRLVFQAFPPALQILQIIWCSTSLDMQRRNLLAGRFVFEDLPYATSTATSIFISPPENVLN